MLFIGSSLEAKDTKDQLLQYLQKENIEYVDLKEEDVLPLVSKAVKYIKENPEENKAVIIDDFGSLPFMAASKYKGIVCAQCSDEHSAKMTRAHNNANMIAIGDEAAGMAIIKAIVKRFSQSQYDGGRHQIRLDMLNVMG